jgi:hypothetical protein
MRGPLLPARHVGIAVIARFAGLREAERFAIRFLIRLWKVSGGGWDQPRSA